MVGKPADLGAPPSCALRFVCGAQRAYATRREALFGVVLLLTPAARVCTGDHSVAQVLCGRLDMLLKTAFEFHVIRRYRF